MKKKKEKIPNWGKDLMFEVAKIKADRKLEEEEAEYRKDAIIGGLAVLFILALMFAIGFVFGSVF